MEEVRRIGGGVDVLLLIFKSLDGVKEETPNERKGIKNLSLFEVIVSESWGCGEWGDSGCSVLLQLVSPASSSERFIIF